MTRRTWSPTGELVDSSLVRIYLEEKPADSKPFKLRIRMKGRQGERGLSYPTRTTRTAAHKILSDALGRGEMFDVGTYRPASETAAATAAAAAARTAAATPPRRRWVEHAIRVMDDMAITDKPKTREARQDALRISCWVLHDNDSGFPGRELLKEYLDLALEPVVVRDPNCSVDQLQAQRDRIRAELVAALPADVRAAGAWLMAHSLPLDEITAAEANKVLAAFKLTLAGEQAAATTRNRKRQVLHHAFEAARLQHGMSNPMDALDLRGYASAKIREVNRSTVMTPQQMDAFLYNVGHDADGNVEPDDQYTACFAMMGHDGLRPSEAIAASRRWCTLPDDGSWGEIGLEYALVHAGRKWADDDEPMGAQPLKWTDHTGQQQTRTPPLSPETVAALRHHELAYGVAKDGRFFSAAMGGPINPALLKRLVAKARDRTFADPNSPHYIERANHPLRTMTAYACRHSAASVMLNSGVPPKEVANRLGHDVAVLLRIYASVMAGDTARANSQIDDYRGRFRRQLCGVCCDEIVNHGFAVKAPSGERAVCSVTCLQTAAAQMLPVQRAQVPMPSARAQAPRGRRWPGGHPAEEVG